LRELKTNPTGNAREEIVLALDRMQSSFKKILHAQNSEGAEWNRAIASREAGPGMRRENTAEIVANNKEFFSKLQEFRNEFYDFRRLYEDDKREAVKLIKDLDNFLKYYGI